MIYQNNGYDMITRKSLQTLTSHYRANSGEDHLRYCGYVVISPYAQIDPESFDYHDAVFGWTCDLDQPSVWEPGCFAVSVTGTVYIATGGSVDDGAQSWALYI